MRQVEKLNEFMNTDCSPELVRQIAEVTQFNKMKAGKSKGVGPMGEKRHNAVYRKGGSLASKLIHTAPTVHRVPPHPSD